MIWSVPEDHPVAEVIYGEWGDDYPAIRIKQPGAIGEPAEPYMEKIVYGDVDVETAHANARLIAAAPTAPHECDDPKCPGNINRIKLGLFDNMLAALKDLLGPTDGHIKTFYPEPGDKVEVWQCHWCGRQYGAAITFCPSDDCPGHIARAMIAEVEGGPA